MGESMLHMSEAHSILLIYVCAGRILLIAIILLQLKKNKAEHIQVIQDKIKNKHQFIHTAAVWWPPAFNLILNKY